MKVIKKIDQMAKLSRALRHQDKKIGFVPTMGYLHRGHLSLVEKAREECGELIISIFVNPKQFGPKEDFDKYPRDQKRDFDLLQKAGVDYIFVPGAEDMYPGDFETRVTVDSLNKIMCGKFRPVHFDGVCTVVLKLFNIIQPCNAYFGEKDYQQLVIIKKMARDLNLGVGIVGCPIVREEDGLAISSRNKYLSSVQRKDATVLFKCLNRAAESIKGGQLDIDKIKEGIIGIFNKNRSVKKVEYFDFRNPCDLEEIKDLEKYMDKKANPAILIAAAVWIGKTRLIDNIIIKPEINIS